MADNPLLVKDVIRAFVEEHAADNPAELSKRVCDHCAQTRCEKVLDKNSWNDPSGYYSLSPTEEAYGRFADTSGGTVMARNKNKGAETVSTETWENTAAE